MSFYWFKMFSSWHQNFKWTDMKIKEPRKSMIKNNSFDSFVKYELGWIL